MKSDNDSLNRMSMLCLFFFDILLIEEVDHTKQAVFKLQNV